MRKVLVVCGVLVSAAGSVFAFQEGFIVIRESLTGYQEVPRCFHDRSCGVPRAHQ
jgi:hypothetical protein